MLGRLGAALLCPYLCLSFLYQITSRTPWGPIRRAVFDCLVIFPCFDMMISLDSGHILGRELRPCLCPSVCIP